MGYLFFSESLRLFLAAALLTVAPAADGRIKIKIDHNTGAEATAAFKFKSVPSPAKDDVAAKARLALVDGEIDPHSADLSALVDGRLPTDSDDPGANFFFNAGSWGGRIRIDLGNVIEIEQVNSYSWHANTRGPQLYRLYASDGTAPAFNAGPKRGSDPEGYGWRLIATVNTIPERGEDGGQYGVSITSAGGALGKYRYLLFDCYVTESADDWGNTFYSEIDVVAKK